MPVHTVHAFFKLIDEITDLLFCNGCCITCALLLDAPVNMLRFTMMTCFSKIFRKQGIPLIRHIFEREVVFECVRLASLMTFRIYRKG